MTGVVTERDIDTFLAKYEPTTAEFARKCRGKLHKRIPRGFEFVYDNYNALVFGFGPTDRPSRAVLSIAVFPRWVTLCFLKGAHLPDPAGLLQGQGKQVRSVRLAQPADLERNEVKALVANALAAVADELEAAPPLQTLVKSVSAKQRPRRP